MLLQPRKKKKRTLHPNAILQCLLACIDHHSNNFPCLVCVFSNLALPCTCLTQNWAGVREYVWPLGICVNSQLAKISANNSHLYLEQSHKWMDNLMIWISESWSKWTTLPPSSRSVVPKASELPPLSPPTPQQISGSQNKQNHPLEAMGRSTGWWQKSDQRGAPEPKEQIKAFGGPMDVALKTKGPTVVNNIDL